MSVKTTELPRNGICLFWSAGVRNWPDPSGVPTTMHAALLCIFFIKINKIDQTLFCAKTQDKPQKIVYTAKQFFDSSTAL